MSLLRGVYIAGDVLQENVFKGPLIKVVQELDVFIKTGPAAVRPVLATAMREDPVSQYSAWALREFLMNAIIHRDYFLGNAPIKFYEYKKNRIEISNPGGLFGRANPDNFPFVNDYRNPLLAEAMKILGMVNKYNRGIAKANKELERNGNPKAQFDVNKLTEFRITIVANGKSGTMNGESGTMILGKFHREYMGERVDATVNATVSATVNATVNDSIVDIVRNNPGIRRPSLLELLTTIDSPRKYRRDSADARILGSAGEKIDGYSR